MSWGDDFGSKFLNNKIFMIIMTQTREHILMRSSRVVMQRFNTKAGAKRRHIYDTDNQNNVIAINTQIVRNDKHLNWCMIPILNNLVSVSLGI